MKKYKVICYDKNQSRIKSLKSNFDNTLEIVSKDLKKVKRIKFTNDANDLIEVNRFIITVPTPVNIKNKPDLSKLKDASKTVGKFIKKGDIVIYESTVYPDVPRKFVFQY